MAARGGSGGHAGAPARNRSTPGHEARPQDPMLRTGALPNGMRYYVRANRMPEKRAYLWLAVNAGSVLEEEDQRGYAHFLEHMAFNGTRRFPRQTLIEFVESSGLRFGPDLNAYTSFDETVYQLTVPTDDPPFVEQGLRILEDWAGGGITLDSAEVVAERGVVLGEWRSRALRDTASQRVFDHDLDVLLGGTRYRDRLPIGVPELLEGATAGPIERFYRDWYSPDLMAVIAVGDFDPEWMEREIRERFGAIAAPGSARERDEFALPASSGPVVDVLRARVAPRVKVLWPLSPRPSDAVEALRSDLVSLLLAQHVQRNLLRIREQRSRPFVHAWLGRERPVRPLEVATVEIVTWPDSLERALGAVLAELERVARHGIPAAALERQKAALLRRMEGEVAGVAARPSTLYANGYVQHFLMGDIALLSPEQELMLAREILPGITPEVMARAGRFWRERQGLKVLVRVPELALGFRPPTRESVLAVFDSVRGASIAPESPGAIAADGALMEQLPEPGRVVAETLHAVAGVIEWRLSNGARVLFKPSWNHPDEMLLRAWSPGGFSRLADSLFFSSGRMVGAVLTEAAGVGAWGKEEARERLAATAVRPPRVHIGYAEESIELGGSPRELETLFQMLHLQFTAPRLDSAALASWASVARYQSRESTIHDELNQLFARGNPRMLPVSTGLADLVLLDEVLAVHRDRFGNAGDFTFMLVGAAPAEQVRPLVERYIASLPATDARETPADPKVRPLTGRTRNRTEVLPVPLAQTLLAFDGPFPTEPAAYFRERQRLSALTSVLEWRLRDRLREQLGGTYGVSVSGHTYRLHDEHYRLLFFFQSAPERMRELTREMFAVLDSVRAGGVTASELARVARVQQRRLETALQRNEYWLDQLELYTRLALPLDRIVSPHPLEMLTPDDLKEAAAAYLPDDSYIHVTQVPKRGVQ